MRLALIIEYEGTDYSGFQFQENASTIQGELEKSINCLTGDIVRKMYLDGGESRAKLFKVGEYIYVFTGVKWDKLV